MMARFGRNRRQTLDVGKRRRDEARILLRLAAAAEHRRHQSEQIGPRAAIDRGPHLGGARLFDLVPQKADIVLSRFTLLRGHVRSLRRTRIGRPWARSAQSMVNFPSRMNTGLEAAKT